MAARRPASRKPSPSETPRLAPERLDEAIAEALSATGGGAGPHTLLAAVKPPFEAARAAIQAWFEAGGVPGARAAEALADAQDALIAALHRAATQKLFRATNPTTSERLAVVAAGGYGRGGLAPGSDIDLLFLTPYKTTPWTENVIETILYVLWDLKLKVGHATRSIDEQLRHARIDHTVRTAALETRPICGDEALLEIMRERLRAEVLDGDGPSFVDVKLAERDRRHKRSGESRYLVEPNLKDGKGGLRDLQTLMWIGRHLYDVARPRDLVRHGVLTSTEARAFTKAESFFWTVRVHLHYLAGRAEERLTFDVQRALAARLGYTERAGARAVERFMKHYFIHARTAGHLTRAICAKLEERAQKRGPRFGRLLRFMPGLTGSRLHRDFTERGGRLDIAWEGAFERDPVNLIRIFQIADAEKLDLHPNAHAAAARAAHLIDDAVRADPEANRLFLDILTSRGAPEASLRWMNEAGVLGRFVRDFGRIVCLMQFNAYHHYTADEHLIRAIGVLSEIEKGEHRGEHPLASEIVRQTLSRRVLYLALFLHDIAKGRPTDHSVAGEKIAKQLCPRLGLEAWETETVAWLVREHLLMSDVAQKRDTSDPRTVRDFADRVQSPEKLRLLLILTVADIRAVGPGVWNGWKGQLLRHLYYETEALLQGGHSAIGLKDRVAHAKAELVAALNGRPPRDVQRVLEAHYDAWWRSVAPETQLRQTKLMLEMGGEGEGLGFAAHTDEFRSVTEVSIYAVDHPGLFARVAGAFTVCGASIVDAKIFTTTSGMALDAFWIQDAQGRPFVDETRIERLKRLVEQALENRDELDRALKGRRARPRRLRAFDVPAKVLIDNQASESCTVIEAHGADRPGLVFDLAVAIYMSDLQLASAQITTYGERAVDVFYVKNMYGLKITSQSRIEAVRERLMAALQPPQAAQAAE